MSTKSLTSGKGRIPNEFIERLLARIDIVDVINARVPLKKKGKEYSACCPFHDEKTPSFTVSSTKQFFHCFGCGVTGNVIKFLMDYENLEFVEAVESLAQFDGQIVPYERSTQTYVQKSHDQKLLEWVDLSAQFFETQLRTHSDKERAIQYIKKRGIRPEIALRYKIGYAPGGWSNLLDFLHAKGAVDQDLLTAGLVTQSEKNKIYDRFRDRIMFPIRDRKGQVIAFGGRVLEATDQSAKYLNSPETPFFHKGHEVYGFYEMRSQLRQIDEIIVVEGYMDVVMLANFGIENVVATLGTATSTHQIERLFKVSKRLVFCFDGDRAGRDAAWKALNSGLPALKTGREMAFLFLPEGEDPDSLVQTEGRDNFLKRATAADSLSQYLLDHIEKEVKIETLEGRAEALALGTALIGKMPNTPIKDMLQEALQSRLQVSAATYLKHAQSTLTEPFTFSETPDFLDLKHLSTHKKQENLTKWSSPSVKQGFRYRDNRKNAPYFKMRHAEKMTSFKYRRAHQNQPTQIFPQDMSFFNRRHSNVEMALIILLNRPELARHLKHITFLVNIPVRGAKLLFSVIRSIQTENHIRNNAQLLQHFHGIEVLAWLEKLSLIDYIFEDEQTQLNELIGILKKLQEENDPKMLALKKMRRKEPLTEAEMRLLQGK